MNKITTVYFIFSNKLYSVIVLKNMRWLKKINSADHFIGSYINN